MKLLLLILWAQLQIVLIFGKKFELSEEDYSTISKTICIIDRLRKDER